MQSSSGNTTVCSALSCTNYLPNLLASKQIFGHKNNPHALIKISNVGSMECTLGPLAEKL